MKEVFFLLSFIKASSGHIRESVDYSFYKLSAMKVTNFYYTFMEGIVNNNPFLTLSQQADYFRVIMNEFEVKIALLKAC